MTPNTDRPTPRDLIETPATLWDGLIQESMKPGPTMTITKAQYAAILERLELARDEGRQEAVRLREALERLVEQASPFGSSLQLYLEALDEKSVASLRDALDEARAILDEVARHGRSSDPEPAPHYEQINGVTYERTVDGHLRLPTRADPALQAAGEPPLFVRHKADCHIFRDNRTEGDTRRCTCGAGATGEGENP